MSGMMDKLPNQLQTWYRHGTGQRVHDVITMLLPNTQ